VKNIVRNVLNVISDVLPKFMKTNIFVQATSCSRKNDVSKASKQHPQRNSL
jgi:hypothetical protein